MGVRLVTEILDHAPSDWTQSERLIVVAIAEQANDETRRGYPGAELIAHRAGIDPASLSRTLRRLAMKGVELRVATGVDRTGRTVYAHRSHPTVYEIPRLCPLGTHSTRTCFQRPDGGPAIIAVTDEPGVTLRPTAGDQTPDEGPAKAEKTPDSGPPIQEATADGGPPFGGQRPDGGPQRPDGGPAHSLKSPQRTSPQPDASRIVKPGWVAKDTKPKADHSVANATTPAARQPSLVAMADVKLMEAPQIIWDWLRRSGYDTFTADDARAIHRVLLRRYPGRTTPGYLRTMASNDSFSPFAEERRTERAKEVDALIVELEKTRPMCEHGTLAGQEPHPTHGIPLCAQCRRGLPAAEQPQRTHPDVDAALTEYRKHYAGDFDIQQIINLAQQAEALHRGGASRDDLIALAGIAAARNIGFITAARKDTHV